jgi:hypothetical protein
MVIVVASSLDMSKALNEGQNLRQSFCPRIQSLTKIFVKGYQLHASPTRPLELCLPSSVPSFLEFPSLLHLQAACAQD